MLQGLVLKLLGKTKAGSREGAREAAGEGTGGDDEPTPWVTVLTSFNTVRTTIAAARLRDEGIPVRIRQEAASSVYPVGVGLLGQIDVLVPEPMADKALDVLEATLGTEPGEAYPNDWEMDERFDE